MPSSTDLVWMPSQQSLLNLNGIQFRHSVFSENSSSERGISYPTRLSLMFAKMNFFRALRVFLVSSAGVSQSL